MVKHVFIWSSGLHIETELKKPIEGLEHLQGIVGGSIELAQARWDEKITICGLTKKVYLLKN
jgi:hypothetical protein